MKTSTSYKLRRLSALITAVAVYVTAAYADGDFEAKFLAENDVAMKKMMVGMAAQASGDVDKDFVDMMVPHHQGAIDMARAELRYGRNETLRRIAQEIVVDQLQEIDAMRLAVGARSRITSDAMKSGGGSMSMRGAN